MTTWTETARAELERYFTRVRPTLESSGADASEVIDDLRRHLDAEVAAAKLAVVTEPDVQRLLARIGAPEPSEASPPPTAPAEPEQPRGKSGKLMRGLLLFAGVLLPAITLVLELATRMCAAAFFDPLPTGWHVALVAFVPTVNFLAWQAIRRGLTQHRTKLAWLNAAAMAVSLWYALLFLPLLLPGVIAVWFYGWGLLPWAPMLSLMAAVGLRRRLWRMGGTSPGALPGFWRGLGLGLLALALVEAPGIVTRIGLQMAASESADQQRTGLRWLRLLGREDTLLRACYGFTRGAREMDIIAMLIGGEKSLTPTQAQVVYYRVTGHAFNSVPAPAVRTGRGIFAELNEWTWDADHGGDRVGGRIRGLSLTSSRLDALTDADAALSYTEWTLEFKNDSTQDREARAQILLPPGGVVSRLTLWVNGEEREAAFAGRSHVCEAYQKVAVQQRRDPVLVTTAGPDRVLMQCFPVPRSGGAMKVRLGITAPLALASAAEGVLRLPGLLERNFSIPEGVRHSVWAGGAGQFKAGDSALASEQAQPGGAALRGQLSNAELASSKGLLRVTRDASQLVTWTRDTRSASGQFIRQTIQSVAGQPPASVVFVLDGSRDMQPHFASIANALSGASEVADTHVLLAFDDVVEVSALGGRDFERPVLQFQPSAGRDNVPALLRAWQLAAAKSNSIIVWIHAPQPLILDSTEPLVQAFERGGHSAPQLYEIQVAPGPDRILEKLDGFSHVHSVLRADTPAKDVADLIRSWLPGKKRWNIERAVVDSESAARAGDAKQADLHLARLWACDEVRRLRRERKTAAAVELAARYQLVTPVSGAVVLENQRQYADADLKPVDALSVPVVPEPSTFILIALGGAAWWLRRRMSSTTRRAASTLRHR